MCRLQALLGEKRPMLMNSLLIMMPGIVGLVSKGEFQRIFGLILMLALVVSVDLVYRQDTGMGLASIF